LDPLGVSSIGKKKGNLFLMAFSVGLYTGDRQAET
jgi:hypothetical protein